MKKIIFMALCFGVYQARAQDYGSSEGINLGVAEDGIGILLDYSYYANRFNNSSFNVAGYMAFANYSYEDNDIPYALYALQLGYTQQVWENYRGNFRIGILGGGQIGYESINNDIKEVGPGIFIKEYDAVVYGPYLGAEADLNLGSNMSLVLRVHETYLINSVMGDLTPYFGIGIRYYND